MTIATTSNKVVNQGNGANTVFNFGFTVRQSSDIVCTYVDANGNETDVTANCVIALNAVAVGAQWAVGGTVTYNPGGVAIAAGTQLVVLRIMPFTQVTAFANQGGQFPAVTEQTADLLEMMGQQINEILGRTPAITRGKDASLYTLTLNPVANALLGWDATGKVLGTVATGGTNLVMPAAAGIAVYTGGTTFISRTLTAGSGVTITNGNGVAGNPTISAGGATVQALVDAASVAWDMSTGTYATLLATGAVGATRAMAAPSHLAAGASYTLQFTQDATGGRALTWNTVFRGYNGSIPHAPNQGPNAVTTYQFESPDGVNLNLVGGAFDSTLLSIAKAGRLTLTTATPVPTADQSNQGTAYFTPYNGTFAEMSQTSIDNTKSPAAVANNSVYDYFVWNDAGTYRCTRGPLWTNDTTRSAGTALAVVGGIQVNNVAITNGPAANLGIYVGTMRSNGTATLDDSKALRRVWNNYNRRLRGMLTAAETTDSWTYTTAAYRQANANTANQLDFVLGLAEDSVKISVLGLIRNTGVNLPITVGVGIDSTTVNSATISSIAQSLVANERQDVRAEYVGYPGIGRHFAPWLEYSVAAGTTTWSGDDGQPVGQTGIYGEVWA